jgi:hypothetical protein
MTYINELPIDAKEIDYLKNYFCTPKGDIYSLFYNKYRLRKPCINKKGYNRLVFSIGGKLKSHLIHRVVANTFIRKSDLLINHKDGNKLNNNVENLEYLTNRENLCHSSILNNGTPGIHYNKKTSKWTAQIHLGTFDNKEDAKDCYLKALERLSINNIYKE